MDVDKRASVPRFAKRAVNMDCGDGFIAVNAILIRTPPEPYEM